MPWKLDGNDNTNPDTDFLGTTDAQPLVIKVEGQERMRFRTDGAIRWGNSLAYPDSLELGSNNPGDSQPFIDFHFHGINDPDYNTRIINDLDGQLTVDANRFRSTGDMGCRNLSVSGELTIT